MIPLATIMRVRELVAPRQPATPANQAVLADLADGWTIVSPYTRTPWRNQEIVWLFGRHWRYVARLCGYEMPRGWCICPNNQRECHCRDPYPAKDGGAVWLIGASPMERRDYGAIEEGERVEIALTLDSIASRGWWLQACDLWTSAHRRRRRRRREERDAVRLWERVLEARRLIVEHLAQPLAYEDVEVDDAGQLLFDLCPGEGPPPLEVIYELPGNDAVKLRVVECEGGVLVCDVEGTDPVAACEYARGLRGPLRRRLVKDQDATNSVLAREEHALKDLCNGRTRNDELYDLILDPTRAAFVPRPVAEARPVQAKLNDDQRQAVEMAMSARDIALVQGPPGTGKTTFIAELVVRHLLERPGDRVVMASQTHQATDNLLRKVHELAPDVPLVRVGRDEQKIADDVKPLWIGAKQPRRSVVRARAKRYRRYVLARAALGEIGHDLAERLFDVQDRYLGDDAGASARSRIEEARLVAGTCYGVSSTKEVRELSYDLAIVEEAGKATPPEALMAMVRADKVLLVGDSRQLEPNPDKALDSVLRQAESDPSGIDDPRIRAKATALAADLKSERDRLRAAGEDAPRRFTAETLFNHLARRFKAESPQLQVQLVKQYRMVSGIGDLVSDVFYDGALQNARKEAGKERDRCAAALTPAHVRLVEVDGQEVQPHGSTSRFNQQEVRVAVRELEALAHVAQAQGRTAQAPLGVAVITGYLAQQRALRRAIAPLDLEGLRVRLGLLDSFQGDEDEVVIVSFARTAEPGYLSRRNRVNVALSRARSLLIVLLHGEAARRGTLGKPLKEVVAYVGRRIEAGDVRYERDVVGRGRSARSRPARVGNVR